MDKYAAKYMSTKESDKMITDEKRAELRAGRAKRKWELQSIKHAQSLHGKRARMGCGWNHEVPGGEDVDQGRVRWGLPPTPRIKRKRKKPAKPGASTNGVVVAVECNSEWTRGGARVQAPMKSKTILKRFGTVARMSYVQAVQHGMIEE